MNDYHKIRSNKNKPSTFIFSLVGLGVLTVIYLVILFYDKWWEKKKVCRNFSALYFTIIFDKGECCEDHKHCTLRYSTFDKNWDFSSEKMVSNRSSQLLWVFSKHHLAKHSDD